MKRRNNSYSMKEKISGIMLQRNGNIRLFIIHLFAVAIISFLICSDLSKLNGIAVLNDEFGYWGIAASLAGYDWKELLIETPYYSYGYSLCLVPLIRFFSSPVIWYKAAILLNLLFLIGSYFLCYSIGKKLFADEQKYIIAFASLITTIYPSNITYAQVAWSETLQYFLVICITYALVLLEERFSAARAICFAVLIIYLYCVHGRNIGVLVIGFFCFLMLLIKNKKNVLPYILAGAVLLIGYMLNRFLSNWILEALWSNSVTSNVNSIRVNTATISGYWKLLTENFLLFTESLYGKFFYLLFGTGFVILVAVIAYVKEEIGYCKSKSFFCGYSISKLWCIGIILMMWGLSSLQAMDWRARKDNILYARYMEQAVGPILLIGILYAIKYIKKSKYIILMGEILFLSGLQSIYNKIASAESYCNSICIPIFGTFYDNVGYNLETTFLLIFGVAEIFALASIMSSFMKKNDGSMIIIVVFTIIFSIEGYQAGTYVEKAREGIERNFCDTGNIIEENKGMEVYYIKNQEKDIYSVNPKYLQFMIPDRSIHVMEKEKLDAITEEDFFLLVNGKDQETRELIENEYEAEELVVTDLLILCKICIEN